VPDSPCCANGLRWRHNYTARRDRACPATRPPLPRVLSIGVVLVVAETANSPSHATSDRWGYPGRLAPTSRESPDDVARRRRNAVRASSARTMGRPSPAARRSRASASASATSVLSWLRPRRRHCAVRCGTPSRTSASPCASRNRAQPLPRDPLFATPQRTCCCGCPLTHRRAAAHPAGVVATVRLPCVRPAGSSATRTSALLCVSTPTNLPARLPPGTEQRRGRQRTTRCRRTARCCVSPRPSHPHIQTVPFLAIVRREGLDHVPD